MNLRIGTAAVPAVLALLTAACAQHAQVVPPAAHPSSDAALSPRGGPTAPSGPATSASVAISDEIRQRCGISDADAYFSFDSSRVTSNDRSPLDQVATCFTRGPLHGRSVKLVGRADPRGSTDYNMTLGESRADAVAGYLAARGVARDHAQSTSRGAIDATGSDETGWQHDRRVDVLLGN